MNLVVCLLDSEMMYGRDKSAPTPAVGWGWYYLSTVIDDYSRYIIHWELCSSMTSDDVSRTIDKAIEKARVTFQNPPCLFKLNHYFCPSELENAIDGWVKYYNERRFHESLDNLTPKDVYLGQGEKIKKIREIIKQNSINKRIFDNKTMKHQCR